MNVFAHPTTDSPRDRLLRAMVRVVGEQGYRQTSVADVIEAANTSRATFYKHFDDKHDCFIAAYEPLAAEIVDDLAAGCDPSQPWVTRMRTGLERIVERFAADPPAAVTAIVEVAAAGADARRIHFDALARISELLDAGGRELTGVGELPENIGLMSAGAVSGLIFDELVAGRARELPALLPDLLFAMLVPYIGPRAATEEMRKVTVATGRRHGEAWREHGAA